MPRRVLVEEFHLSIFVAASTDEANANAVLKVSRRSAFRSNLRRAVLNLLRRYMSLDGISIRISR
jgi:hypothetical protein